MTEHKPTKTANKPAKEKDSGLWVPTLETAVSILLVPRVASALWNGLADCDETFNYWEPLHYLLYGFGLQTWEYSPVYALRSYLYLVLHKVVAQSASSALGWSAVVTQVFGATPTALDVLPVVKPLVFYSVRGVLAIVSAYCEALLYRASIPHFGRRTAQYLLWILVWNAGIFHASTAFLPSSFVMALVMLFLAAWMMQRHFLAIVWGVVAVLWGWPYVGVLFVPFFVDTLLVRGILPSLLVGAVIGAVVLGLEVGVNYLYYDRIVLPAWNILQYNVLSHETDSTLYGTEPWSYYIVNLALNMNIAAVLGLASVGSVFLLPRSTLNTTPRLRLFAFLSPLFIWMAIMFAQAHKEERFLFPVYPLLCLGAAITLHAIVASFGRMLSGHSRIFKACKLVIVFSVLGVYALLSVSRVVSNTINYTAPLRVYQHLHDNVLPSATTLGVQHVRLCLGKEWYRFPSSFFLPSNATELSFVNSSFHGLLPKPFEQHEHGTSIIPTHMNRMNQEEPSRYTPLEDCDYVVDMNLPTQKEIKLWEHPNEWELIYADRFLDADRSRSPYRAFFIPVLTPRHTVFAKYAVYKKKASIATTDEE